MSDPVETADIVSADSAPAQPATPDAAQAAAPAPPTQAEAPAPPTIRFADASHRVNKDRSASAVVTVLREGDLDGEVSADYFTEDVTAVAGTHYTPAVGTLRFPPGESRKTFVVQIREDSPARNTYLKLALHNPRGAQLESPAEAVLTIMSDDVYRLHGVNPLLGFFRDPVNLRVFRHIALVLALIGATHLLSNYVTYTAEKYSTKWSAHLQPKTSQQLSFPDNDYFFSELEKSRLNQQVARIRERLTLHLEVMNFYYTRYYMAIITFSIAAGVAAIILVLISKRGWERTNEYVITAFLVMASSSVFYGAFPGVFQQEQNIVDNKVLYLKFLALENEVFSYAVTGEALNYDATRKDLEQPREVNTAARPSEMSSKPPAPNAQSAANGAGRQASGERTQEAPANRLGIYVEPREFIHYVDLQLAQDNIAIGFDYKQLPNYKNAFDTNK